MHWEYGILTIRNGLLLGAQHTLGISLIWTKCNACLGFWWWWLAMIMYCTKAHSFLLIIGFFRMTWDLTFLVAMPFRWGEFKLWRNIYQILTPAAPCTKRCCQEEFEWLNLEKNFGSGDGGACAESIFYTCLSCYHALFVVFASP